MRFEVSRVLDTIEQRLTTDVTLAQAVVDLSDVARFEQLDGGKTVSLLRVGMVLDALARYLVDGGAMLYAVAGRELLAEGQLTSKERMVLGRWTDDGLIEATPTVGDRVLEIADFTGMPVIAVRDYKSHTAAYPWLDTAPERVLRLVPKPGKAVLVPAVDARPEPEPAASDRAVAKAKAAVRGATEGEVDAAPEGASEKAGRESPPAGFVSRGIRASHTRISTRAIEPPAPPSGLGAALLARFWKCPEQECPSFSEWRRAGQPVPRMVKGVPTCPRHGTALKDVGPRPAEHPVALVIDDVVRRRFPVTEDRPTLIGREPDDPDNDIVLGEGLHEAAQAWIGKTHARLSIRDGRLIVTDLSENGTVVWRRDGPDRSGDALRLYDGQECELTPWDSVELYTGVELVPGNRRVVGGPVTAGDVRSVLVDAPTVAFRRPPNS